MDLQNINNIYECMKNGIKPEDLRRSLEASITEAKERLEEERKAEMAKAQQDEQEQLMAEARAHLINSILAYGQAIGLYEELPSEAEVQLLEKEIRNMEKELIPQMKKVHEVLKGLINLDIHLDKSEDKNDPWRDWFKHLGL